MTTVRVFAAAFALCALIAICAAAVLSSEPLEPARVTVDTAGGFTPYQPRSIHA